MRIFVLIAIWLLCFTAWIDAIVHTAQADEIFLMLLGIVIPPLGVLHGIMIWLGLS